MKTEILEYLATFSDDQYHVLNQFLNDKFGGSRLDDIRKSLNELSDKKLIDVAAERHSRFGLHTANIHPEHNVIADLNNWPVSAKISDEGRKEIRDSKKNWYETEIARFQYEDYPKVQRQAKNAIIISIIAVILSAVLGVLALLIK